MNDAERAHVEAQIQEHLKVASRIAPEFFRRELTAHETATQQLTKALSLLAELVSDRMRIEPRDWHKLIDLAAELERVYRDAEEQLARAKSHGLTVDDVQRVFARVQSGGSRQ